MLGADGPNSWWTERASGDVSAEIKPGKGRTELNCNADVLIVIIIHTATLLFPNKHSDYGFSQKVTPEPNRKIAIFVF